MWLMILQHYSNSFIQKATRRFTEDRFQTSFLHIFCSRPSSTLIELVTLRTRLCSDQRNYGKSKDWIQQMNCGVERF